MKMTSEQKVKLLTAVESLRPEAKEFLDSLKTEPKTTKDHYGRVMSFISRFDNKMMGQLFLVALTKEGYPKDTASQIMSIMGW